MKFHYIITFIAVVLLYTPAIFSAPDSLSDSVFTTTAETSAASGAKDTALQESNGMDSTTADTTLSATATEVTSQAMPSDSLKKLERQRSLLAKNTYYRQIYQQHPQSLDSLYNTSTFYPFRIYQADGMNLSEILYFHPDYISVPTTLASNLNRFLYYGFPAMHTALFADQSLFKYTTDPTVGLNLYSAAEMKYMRFFMPGIIYINQQPSALAKPEMSILWENGVFNENTLNIRFARPIAERFYLGIFSNYQYFRRQSFNHQAGGMYAFYKGIYDLIGYDTSYVSYRGINPLTDEHVTSIRLAWTAKNGTETRLSYKYADLDNDLATEYFVDTTEDTTALAWEKRAHYDHHIQAHLLALPIGNHLRIGGEAFLQKNVNRISPVSNTIIDNPVRRGEAFMYGGGIHPFVQFNTRDTLGITFSARRDEVLSINESKWVEHYTRAAAAFTWTYTIPRIDVQSVIEGSAGYSFVKINDHLRSLPVWEATLSNKLGNQRLNLFALQDILPPNIPFDTALQILPVRLFMDPYQSYGTECALRYKLIGLNLGFCYMYGVDRHSVKKAWPHQIPPYEEPQWVATVTPLFGKWHGLSLFSQWQFAQARPFIKSKSILSFHLNREGRTNHLCMDLGVVYWSERNPVDYAGITTWHRSIIDVNLKTTVQIKTFRLFYKIDNLFNKKIAYVPGYFMPGLIFRWGFNWLIQG